MTPLPATTTPQPATSTAVPPTVNPAIVPAYPTLEFAAPPAVVIQPSNFSAVAFTTSGGFSAGGINLPGDVNFIAYNPVDPNSYIRVDSRGMLHLAPIGGSEGVYTFSPYHDTFQVASADQNQNLVIDARWSPSGWQFAFIIASPPNTDHIADGVWFWQPDMSHTTGPSYQLIRDCVECGIVQPTTADLWRSRSLQWANDNAAILVEMDLPYEGRRGISVIYAVRDANIGERGPNIYRYDYGSWALDQNRIIVSGRRPDGRVIIGSISRDGSGEQVVFDASAAGLWMQNAVQRPGGQIVALGRSGDPNGPMSIYDSSGRALTGPIGDGPPRSVDWSCDRSAVSVVANGRRYIAQVSGSVSEVGGRAGNWVCQNLPSGAQSIGGQQAPQEIPSGVIAGSQYQPGQQLRIYRDALNLRSYPGTDSGIVDALGYGEYIRIVAGPYPDPNGRYVWWEVMTADSVRGWLAAEIDGYPAIGP